MKSNGITRRAMLAAASLTAAGAATVGFDAVAQTHLEELKSPSHKPLQPFKYDIEASAGKSMPGGSAKQANVDEFPISESMAGVSMRLSPGGLRELHWHAIAAEWAYVIKGNVRVTVLGPNGQPQQADFGPGDVWYFPKGHGHSLQGLGPGEAHFILVFDNGYFSEFGTFSLTDWLGHTPADVLSRNLNLPAARVRRFPPKEAYILQGKIPPAPEPLLNPQPIENQFQHKFRLAAAEPFVSPGGEERFVSSKEFPIQTTMTASIMDLKPGALREMHWHPNADEWQYYITGRSRVSVFGAHGRVATEEFGPGQVGFIKQGFGHYVQQIGEEPTSILILFNSPFYEQISLSELLAANPPSVLADNFDLSSGDISSLPKSALAIVK
ncbi:MAG: cupin domain-containing protein [Acidobacteriaceae bacterium]